MQRHRTRGVTVAEALVSMGVFAIVMAVALGAMNAALRQHVAADSQASVERNLLQASSLMRSEARCAARIYGQDTDFGAEVTFTNNFFDRENPPVMVKYQWNRREGSLTRRKHLVGGTEGPYLVASAVTDFQYRDIESLPMNTGGRVRMAVGNESLVREAELLLLPRSVVSRPVQGGYYSSVFWLSFWKGWLEGVKIGSEGG